MNNREEAYGVLVNTLLEKHDLRNDMNMNRYGKTSDEVIIKNLLIMCPDIDYELSRGKELKELTDWLKEYCDYGMLLFNTYKNRIERESLYLMNSIELKKKTVLFKLEDVEKSILPEVQRGIFRFIDYKTRGLVRLENWNETSERLMKLKHRELVNFSYKLSEYYREFHHGGEREYRRMGLENIRERERTYLYNTRKTDIVNWLEGIIRDHLNVEIRDKELRNNVRKGGYKCLILIEIYLNHKEKMRRELIGIRKENKKEKRRERIKKEKAN